MKMWSVYKLSEFLHGTVYSCQRFCLGLVIRSMLAGLQAKITKRKMGAARNSRRWDVYFQGAHRL
jgi:hypothetical protein